MNDVEYDDGEEKKRLMRELFGHVGKGVHLDIDFHCELGRHIFIGDNVVINMNSTFIDNHRIDIGNNVLIAPNVQIYTGTHSTRLPSASSPKTFRAKASAEPLRAPSKSKTASGSAAAPFCFRTSRSGATA